MLNKNPDNNKTYNYKNYYSWILIIALFVLMLVVFLAFGEINLSKLNWLVGVNGKKWGLITTENGKPVATAYWGFGYNNGGNMISPYIFIIMVGILLLIVGIALFLMFLNKIKFSSLPFIFASWAVFFVIIVTGLLQPTKNASFQWQILVRVLVILITYPLIFFPFNFIFKKLLINTKFGERYIDDLIKSEKQNAKYINEINKYSIKRKKEKEDETIKLSNEDI